MGRELKRVPLDFDYPMGQIWKGYWNPYSAVKCYTCEGTGYSPEARKFEDEWYHLGDFSNYVDLPNGRHYNANAHQYKLTQLEVDALLENHRLWDLTKNGRVPTPNEVNEWAKANPLSHDSLNKSICCEAVLKSKNIPVKCPICHGSGNLWFSEDIEKKANEWWDKERYEPPTGEGYQLWETTSEGSPCSPVFKTIESLAEWCAENATVFGKIKQTKEQWIDSFKSEPDLISHREGNAIFI